MSYYVEFDRVFIRTVSGYTPLILLGDSSVYEGSSPRARMARKWLVFQGLLGVTEEKILQTIEPMLGSDEHWKKNGKWVDDKGLISWVKNGCKHAVVLEDLLEANNRSFISCHLHGEITGFRGSEALECYVHNTLEMEDWICRAKKAISDKPYLSPVISLNSGDRVRHPSKPRNSDEMVVLKYGQYYLTAHDDKSTHWSKNPKSALVLSAEEMKNLHITGRMVSASVLTNAHNFIVAYTPPEGGPVRYLNKLAGSRGFRYSLEQKCARRYSTKAAAQKAIESAKRRCPLYNYEVQVAPQQPC